MQIKIIEKPSRKEVIFQKKGCMPSVLKEISKLEDGQCSFCPTSQNHKSNCHSETNRYPGNMQRTSCTLC